MQLTHAERLKFELLAGGLAVTQGARARLDELREARPLTPADFASTSGIILALEDDVWVNAPIEDFNPNFVQEPPIVLEANDEGFTVRGRDLSSSAQVWLPPAYHGRTEVKGRSINDFVFSHGDRVRLSPLRGCAMKCKFCNVPYEDPYERKPVDSMLSSLRIALSDPLQPAQHVLISGGTPGPRDVTFLRSVYETVLIEFVDVDIDIMMVPVEGLFDLRRLEELGVGELSINIELFDPMAARELMPHKARQGTDTYLRFIEEATEVLGPGRVRSMLMVGLEPPESTLAGVDAILGVGGVPVLSPFRPDPVTPLASRRPLDAQSLLDTYEAAVDLATAHRVNLGPDCPTCTHNTLTLARRDGEPTNYPYPLPVLV